MKKKILTAIHFILCFPILAVFVCIMTIFMIVLLPMHLFGLDDKHIINLSEKITDTFFAPCEWMAEKFGI